MRATLLKRDAWEHKLGWYSRGPAINVRLYGIYDKVRKVEEALDIDFDEHEKEYGPIDADGWVQYGVVKSEFEWFKEWIGCGVPGDALGALDADRFHLAGRSGGWLVYDISDREGDEYFLTTVEHEALRRVWERVPDMVDDVEWEIVTRYTETVLDRRQKNKSEEARAREWQLLKIAAVQDDVEGVRRHLANYDEHGDHDYDPSDMAVAIVEQLRDDKGGT